MALQQKSLLLYGLEVTAQNRSLDYQLSSGGPVKLASLNIGFYSLSSLCIEIERAMNAVDNSVSYAASADRNFSGGLENRVTISISGGAYFKLLFGSGPRVASTVAGLIGFNLVDRSGFLTYTGNATCGTALITTFPGYSYQPPELSQQVQGARSISTSGLKEAIVFSLMEFTTVEFKYEAKAKCLSEWKTFFQWAIRQRGFDFTPEYDVPNTVYDVTLDKTAKDSNGMGFEMKEMLPQFPNLFTTGPLTLRLRVSGGTFIF